MNRTQSLAALALVIAFGGCRKGKSAGQVSQDSLLIRDADLPGADHRMPDDNPEMKTEKRAEPSRTATIQRENPQTMSPVNEARPVSTDRCDSPSARDQHLCLKSLIAVSDAGLDNTYQDLIAALTESTPDRREARASVSRLRAAERQWLDYRDKECRRQTFQTEGKLWARTRAKCLGALSVRRQAELLQNLMQVRRGH